MDNSLPSELYVFFAAFYGTLILFTLFYMYILSRIFRKAGQPAWAAWVPVYNNVIYCRITGKPDWWALLYFIPMVNMVIGVLCSLSLAERFKKDMGFTIGLILVPFIFLAILAFDDSRYLQDDPNRLQGLDNVLDAQ